MVFGVERGREVLRRGLQRKIRVTMRYLYAYIHVHDDTYYRPREMMSYVIQKMKKGLGSHLRFGNALSHSYCMSM